MLKNFKLHLLLVSVLFSGLGILALYLLAARPEKGHSGFIRHFGLQAALVKTITLDYNSYYLAGSDKDKIFLGNLRNPLHSVGIQIPSLDTIHINIATKGRFTFAKARLSIYSPYFEITDPILQNRWMGRISDWKAEKISIAQISNYVLDECLPISKLTIISRGIKNQQFVIGKQSRFENFGMLFPSFLKKQNDGIFSLDGIMLYESDNSRFVYVYFYRGSYIVSDSALLNQRQFSTIDTLQNHIVNASDYQSGQVKISQNTMIVNRHAAMNTGKLFVLSKVMGSNENTDSFKKTSVIDVYDTTEGKYLTSFYIPDENGEKLKEFQVLDKYFLARYERTIRLYRINTL